MTQIDLRFDGSDYDRDRDDIRLTGQCLDVYNLMKDGQWRSLDLISKQTGYPHASISAQLRHLRKTRFGSHTVRKNYIANGLYIYKLIPNLAGQHKLGLDEET